MAEPFWYAGFSSPNYTQVPDDVFDLLMPRLTEAELRVLLYIIRRTFGFKKDADAISINQMVEGITTREGKVLDSGTGLARRSVVNGLKGLEAKGVILAYRRQSAERGHEPTTYSLRFLQTPSATDALAPVQQMHQPLVQQMHPQETVVQETVEQETGVEISNGHDPAFDRVRSVLINYVADFAREFADQASLKASTTRTLTLYRRAGLDVEAFVDMLYQARTITKERSAAIKAKPVGDGLMPVKPKMAYFFAVLEDLLARQRE